MLPHFLRYQRAYEVGFWLAYFGINDLVGALSVLTEYQRLGLPLETWKPYVWEFTSGAAFLILLPGLIAFDRRWPVTETELWSRLGLHALITVPFSLAHVGLMVAMRKGAYALQGLNYDFGNWPVELLYEYRKDVLTYFTLLVILYVYRYLLRRQRGDARFVAEGDDGQEEEVPERMLVRKRGREFVIRVQDVDWVEASGNYVNLHIGDRIYPLRETMNRLEARLNAERFVRVHRSAIVNLDRIDEIRPLDAGDYRIRLHSGAEINFSRRYRARLKNQLGAAAEPEPSA